MSRVSTFVQGSDFKFYRNPVLYGDDWYLCFDDDDPPEVVVKTTVKREARKLAGDRLAGAGVKFKILEARTESYRCFPPTYTGFHKAFSFFVELKEPLPVGGPALLKHDGMTDFPSTECVFLTFDLEFDAADVAKLFVGEAPSPHLLRFLGVGSGELEERRKRLQKSVVKQHPMLRGCLVTEEVLRLVCGERLRLRRVEK